MNLKTKIAGLVLLLILAGCASKHSTDLSDVFIQADDLKKMLEANDPIALIDVRPHKEYLSGHIPGAQNIWRTDLESNDFPYKGMAIDASDMASLLGEKGISENHTIVLYDNRSGAEASRVCLLLKQYGHNRVFVLDGGLPLWNGELTDEIPLTEKTNFYFIGTPVPHMNVSYERFEKLRTSPGVIVIDARSADEFNDTILITPGHVPDAVNICYTKNLDQSNGEWTKLKSVNELREIYASVASPDDTVLVYCKSGVRSAFAYLILTELLDYKHVYNFDGSWNEWSYIQQAQNSAQFTDNQKQ